MVSGRVFVEGARDDPDADRGAVRTLGSRRQGPAGPKPPPAPGPEPARRGAEHVEAVRLAPAAVDRGPPAGRALTAIGGAGDDVWIGRAPAALVRGGG